MGYTPEAWATFSGAIAAVAGALTGLLFVALSVKGGSLLESITLRSRAAQTLVLFMTSVLIAVVLAAPQSSVLAIAGVSLLVGAGGGLYWLIPSVIASLVGGVINAWLFLIRLPG